MTASVAYRRGHSACNMGSVEPDLEPLCMRGNQHSVFSAPCILCKLNLNWMSKKGRGAITAVAEPCEPAPQIPD